MALATYNDLVSTVSSYLARSDLNSIIPTFVELAQLRMTRDLLTSDMIKIANKT